MILTTLKVWAPPKQDLYKLVPAGSQRSEDEVAVGFLEAVVPVEHSMV